MTVIRKNPRRFNKGGNQMRLLSSSIKQLGFGRSILIDRDGTVICGNDVYDVAMSLGKKVVVVETDGDVLVAVRRTDLSATDPRAMELQLVDNLIQEKNLEWDTDEILRTMQEKLSFDPRKWGGHSCLVKELDLTELLKDGVKVKDKTSKSDEVEKMDRQLSLFD